MALKQETVSREYKYGFRDDIEYVYRTDKGLSEDIVREISGLKDEPEWMLKMRLRGYNHFLERPMPDWGGDLDDIDFNDIRYYLKPSENESRDWDDVPDKIRETFDRLGIPEAERKFLAGVGAQYDSEVVYHKTLKHLEEQGVVFMGTDAALKEYPEMFKEYFATLIPPEDNKFAALNTAVNSENMGQFERTIIIGDEDCQFHYIEGCTAPTYTTNSLHAAVVEVIAKPGAKVRYTTLQNWSDNVYNLVTKRAYAYENSTVEWVDANIGSRLTMKYPSVYLVGKGAKAEILSVAYAGKGMHQDAGAKAIHLASDTQSRITSKSVSQNGGRVTYRGHLAVAKGAKNVKSNVRCDALLLDTVSRSDTYPYMDIEEEDASITHEATVGKISEDVLYYMMSRGLTENEAMNMVVLGFLEVFTKELPMEYAVEFNRLIKMEIEGNVG